MTFEALVLAVVLGAVAGYLAGFVMKGGGYGLKGDMALGVGGSIVGCLVFRTLGTTSGPGWFAMVAVSFVGAVIVIFAQRTFWAVRT